MKKFLLTMIATLALALAANATVTTIDFSAQGYANAQAVTSLTVDPLTLTFAKGSGGTAPTYYTTGTGLRLYTSNTLTVTCVNKITSITFTFSGTYTFGAATADVGTYTE